MGDSEQEKSAHELLLEKLVEQQEAIKLETLKYQESKAASEAQKAASEAEKAVLETKAESEKPKVSDEELLKKEQALVAQATAEADKAAAEARKAALDEMVPTGEAKPKEGDITVDENSGYFAALAAYQATRCLAREITNEIDAVLPASDQAKILISDSMEFCGNDVLLLQITKQLNFWEKELKNRNEAVEKLLPEAKEKEALTEQQMEEGKTAVETATTEVGSLAVEAVSAAALLPLLGGVLSSTADIIGYFKTDYNIIGKTASVGDLSLRASLAGDLRSGTREVYFPCFHRVTQSPILDLFSNGLKWREKLQQNLDLLNSLVIEPLNAQETTLSAAIGAIQEKMKKLKEPQDEQEIAKLKAELEQKQSSLQEVIKKKVKPELAYARAVGIVNAFDQYNKDVTSVEAGNSYPPLAQAAIRGWLDEIEITHLLFATVASSGGELVTSKNFFRTPKLAFLAGSVVSYVLATTAGTVVSANTHVSTEYVKFDIGQDHPPTFKKCSELARNSRKT